ncbi:mucin-binding protein [Paucilactobacillus suebicus]|uniref:Gram-positive cocci surface proteins LPxTG domain-containing protein n=1 Tax=Paucilactobacillus suebicus DSM 5007 = KCTC 3549 TaxID=1423807 RepID=A0A0R1W1D7_9LACO|nr:LPXTG cell wall anchor domain-containing protein [Paucilactobacillus suebicus]KRM09289.1 hypothetical protein FD16_GL001880 [Paucilactobacillus suebicus DSM 5007 = KCTC 3549]
MMKTERLRVMKLHLVHKTVPIGPDNPETPGQPIHPDDPDGPTWPAGTDKASLTKTITRTINYLDKSTGKVVSKQVTQTVTYNRTAIVDEVTGALLGYDTNGDGNVDTTNEDAAWVAANGDQWSLVTSPDLSDDGYGSPSLAQVDSVTVTADTADSVVNVYYDTPSTPSTSGTSGTSGTPSTPLVNTSTTVTNGGINGKLPQTGDEKNTNLSIMGVILLALSSVLALFGLGKRRETK